MENGQLHDDKLFRAVNDRLSDYEAPANGADWDAMSRALDSLPKSARFQWRISLNSLLVILGVTGLSVLGFAVANHSGNSNKKAVPQVATENKTQPEKNSVATNIPLPVKNNSTVDANTQMNVVAVNTNSVADNSNPSDLNAANTNAVNNDGTLKTKKHKGTDLYFGDQINPNKGFVIPTKEDINSLTPPDPISNPNVFYDIDPATGKVKTIIHKDSSLTEKKPFFSDSTSTMKPLAPTNGDVQGFDPQAQ